MDFRFAIFDSGTEIIEIQLIGLWGNRGIGIWGYRGIHSRRFFSLLDMPFLFYYGESIRRSMPVFSWFVEQLMHNGIAKMGLLAGIH
jgi:hypothetical protein